MNPAPGFRKNPGHRIATRRADVRVRVTLGGELIADRREALVMHEGSYAPVYYLPRKDVKMERLERTSHRHRVESGAGQDAWQRQTDPALVVDQQDLRQSIHRCFFSNQPVE